MNLRRDWTAAALTAVLTSGLFVGAAHAGALCAWGNWYYTENTPVGDGFAAVAAGWGHSVALREDGSLTAWGADFHGQCRVPAGNDFVAVTAGWHHNLALTSEGKAVAWGFNRYGQCNTPPDAVFLALAAGGFHSLALRMDGTLDAWGLNDAGQCNVPPDNDFVAVAAGGDFSVALREDGTATAWGGNSYGQCTIPENDGFLTVAAGDSHSLALTVKGSLMAWGQNDYGQCNVPEGNDFVAVACGERNSFALTVTGLLLAWGRNDYGQCNVPEGHRFAAVGPGWTHTVALVADIDPTREGNRAPVAHDLEVVVLEDESVTFTVQASDPDGDELTYELATLPSHGTLSGDLPVVTYAPAPDFNGADAFTFDASDGNLSSNIAKVQITVEPANDAPIAVALVNRETSVVLEEESWLGTSVTLNASQSWDPDGDVLSFEWDFTSDGIVDASSAVADATYPLGGPYTAVVRVTDPAEASEEASVTVTVTPGSILNQVDNLEEMVLDCVLSGLIAPQIQRSLLVKLEHAAVALLRDKPNATKVAANNLKALLHHVTAQQGKKIDADVAAEMIERLTLLIAGLGG